MADKVIETSDLGHFLVSGALYQPVVVDGEVKDVARHPPVLIGGGGPPQPRQLILQWSAPETVKRYCNECKAEVTWEHNSNEAVNAGLRTLMYRCRSCKREWFTTWLHVQFPGGNRLRLEKIGHIPRLEVTLPPDFEKALGPRVDLYRKGMTARHNGYGIGALPYFRRLIEETTNEMLTLLEQALALAEGDNNAALEKIAQAKAGTRFEDKVNIAASVLPAHLRPGGVNPFADLYQLLSNGIHARTDADCIDIVDGMDLALKHIYTRLKSHAEQEKSYQDATKNIRTKVEKWTQERKTP